MEITARNIPHSVEALQAIKEDIPEQVQVEEICQGLKAWENPINRFYVMRLHRSADPRKRTQAYIDEAMAGMGPSEWMREHELVWEALEGRPVYGYEFAQEFHVSKSSLGWNPSLPVLRGWDFWLNPACLFAQLMPHQRLFVLRECIGSDIDLERFSEEVNRLGNEWFPGARYFDFVDPTGVARMGTNGRTHLSILSGRPIRAKKIFLGANAFAQRRTAVVQFLNANIKGLPCYLIDPSCEVLIKGFNGGYHYGFSSNGELKPDPEKNACSHIHDANQYLCSRCLHVNLQEQGRSYKPVEPVYGRTRAMAAAKQPSVD